MAGFLRLNLLSTVLLVFVHVIYVQTQSFELRLDKENKYILIWNIDNENRIIHFEVLVETQGFVAFGVTNDGKMKGADLIIATQDKNGFIAAEDYHGMGENEKPVLDNQQDWIVTMGSKNGTHTNLNFYRAFDTGDDKDDVVFTDVDTYFIWSYSPNNSQVFRYHGDAKSGTFKINMFSALLGTSWLDHSNHNPMDHASPITSPKSTTANTKKGAMKKHRKAPKTGKGAAKGAAAASGKTANEGTIDSGTRDSAVNTPNDAPEIPATQKADDGLNKLETTLSAVAVEQTIITTKPDQGSEIPLKYEETLKLNFGSTKRIKGSKKTTTSKKPKPMKHASVKVAEEASKPTETTTTPAPGSAGLQEISAMMMVAITARIFIIFVL